MAEYKVKLLCMDEIHQWEEEITDALENSKEVWEEFQDREDIFIQLEEGHAQYWMILEDDSVVYSFMTQICDASIIVFWAYGELNDEILNLCNQCTQNLGAMYGAKWIEVHGRKGWLERLAPWGFKFKKVVVYKPVEMKRMN